MHPAVVVLIIAMWLIGLAAWATHIIVCIKAGAWLLLLAGAIAFPVGVVHGVGVWVGIF